MTTIDVLWLNKGNGDSIARGTWDHYLLGEMFDGRLGRFPHGLTFEHTELAEIDPLSDEGAVVVISGRWHAGDEAWVQDQINRLPWVVLLVVSDEESTFDHAAISHPAMKRWCMTPRPDRMAGLEGAYLIGEGPGPGTREALAVYHAEQDERPIDVGFIGQVTHSRRTEMMAALDHLTDFSPLEVTAAASPGFTQGLDRERYTDLLVCSKIAPCPAGPATPDSFRFYEALEAGCLPLADLKTPEGWLGYWDLVYGPTFTDVIPRVDSWSSISARMPNLLENWQHRANRAGAWWCQVKHGMIQRMADDIGALTEETLPVELADLITVVITASPIPSHPSTEILDLTIASIRVRLPDCTIIVAFDGVRPEQLERKADYDEYVRRVVWKCQHDWANVVPVVADEFRHQAGMVKLALTHVETPMILMCEQDTPLIGDILWSECVNMIASGEANLIRFSHESAVLPSAEFMMLDRQAVCADTAAVMVYRTAIWSQRPHLASTRFYRAILDKYIGDKARTMIEDLMYGVCNGFWREEGVPGWERFRLYLYAEPNEDGSIQRSDHTDGRGDDPKFDCIYEYPDNGPGPDHTPRATSWRVD